MTRTTANRRRIWTAPLLVAVATLAGLGSALYGAGPSRWIAWMALSAPIVVAAWHIVRIG